MTTGAFSQNVIFWAQVDNLLLTVVDSISGFCFCLTMIPLVIFKTTPICCYTLLLLLLILSFDSNIILMLADDMACNARNPRPGICMKAATSLIPSPHTSNWRGCLIFVFCFCFSYIATVFNNANQQINVYGDDIEVDYRGYEVSFNTQWLEVTSCLL